MRALANRHRLPDRPVPPRESRVAVVRAGDFPSHREALDRAIALAGGLGFIEAGQTVLLKPAVNSGNRYPATTDPETVWAVAEMVKEAGGQPFVADRTMFMHSTETAFAETEIRDAAAQAGIPCRALEDDESLRLRHPLAGHWWGSARTATFLSQWMRRHTDPDGGRSRRIGLQVQARRPGSWSRTCRATLSNHQTAPEQHQRSFHGAAHRESVHLVRLPQMRHRLH